MAATIQMPAPGVGLPLFGGAGAEEAHAADYLGGYAAGVAVLQSEVFLRHIYGKNHGQRGAHADERESAHAGRLAFALTLYAHAAAKQHAEHQLKDGAARCHLVGDDILPYIKKKSIHFLSLEPNA